MFFQIMAMNGALPANVLPGIVMSIIIFQRIINGIQHTIILGPKMDYNPGFLTTRLVLNPFCVLTIFYAWKFNILTPMDWILPVIVGGAYILILMLNTTRLRREKSSF
ncbi:hypothetical protein [Methanobacterium alcaliphilum]|uniref:hypothetical protein n=1 Tax=Methanobacterium alcaliphilum TaxID=392018 RepID=UPI00200A1BE0|nr:hypothetical protein [Methanobacterium alcaliphilum]MCK9152276.1 hypothetical protein [Methanobacterium alcaliphilum]